MPVPPLLRLSNETRKRILKECYKTTSLSINKFLFSSFFSFYHKKGDCGFGVENEKRGSNIFPLL